MNYFIKGEMDSNVREWRNEYTNSINHLIWYRVIRLNRALIFFPQKKKKK